ncbi:MAG: UDPGP type 1 family protein [Pirellulaceae bacterium]|nr:UDPGP type 1 family protein [Pirellulaceae bacterium]
MTSNRSFEHLTALLESFNQKHLLQFWDDLTTESRLQLTNQIQAIDWDNLRLAKTAVDDSVKALAMKAVAPPAIRLDGSGANIPPTEARALGETALSQGKIGLILVAGGQGSRLGFDHPKGMFPIGPISNASLFQILTERLLAVGTRYGAAIPLYIMTSPVTHKETVDFFTAHNRFGLAPENLTFFCQGTMPARAAQSGKLLMKSKDSLCLSPDGHGGMLPAMDRNGILINAEERNLDHLFYCQVDNPLVQICDPLLVGYHLHAQSELTTQVVSKTGPLEKVGNVVLLDGHLRIIEYSDLPREAAIGRTANGELKLWAGNMGVHIFSRKFLQRMVQDPATLPFHLAKKKVAHIDPSGNWVEPSQPNAIKYERFIFDLLPFAHNAIVVEGRKSECFAPVKNTAGSPADTPQTAQAAIVALHKQWLREADAHVEDGILVEVSPLWALDANQVAQKIEPGLRVTQSQWFGKAQTAS